LLKAYVHRDTVSLLGSELDERNKGQQLSTTTGQCQFEETTLGETSWIMDQKQLHGRNMIVSILFWFPKLASIGFL